MGCPLTVPGCPRPHRVRAPLLPSLGRPPSPCPPQVPLGPALTVLYLPPQLGWRRSAHPTAIGCERGRTELSPRARTCQWARPPGLMDAPPSAMGSRGSRVVWPRRARIKAAGPGSPLHSEPSAVPSAASFAGGGGSGGGGSLSFRQPASSSQSLRFPSPLSA